jgi:eukaryotic-like serine/threonine-protein kinase
VDCLDAELVVAFLEGRLEPEVISAIETHVADCPDCMDLLGEATRSTPNPASPSETQGPPGKARPPLPRGAGVGRYLILDLVGHGGMGDVYAAYDPELDRRIAIKLLSVEGSGVCTDEARARLLREAKAIARLSHPNVVVVYDTGTWEDRVFIAMEFIEGDTLAHWLKSRPRSWQDVRDVFVSAGRGLAAAHAAGLVHRDFKPQNVMVGRDGKACVMDFGLARSLLSEAAQRQVGTDVFERGFPLPDGPGTVGASLTRTGVLIGTPTYMAPEQFLAEPVDVRTDQFSFCVALYEGLYGGRPFAGETMADLKDAVLKGRLTTPSGKQPVPAWLQRVVLRGLRTDRAERFGSMSDLLAALASWRRQRRRWPCSASSREPRPSSTGHRVSVGAPATGGPGSGNRRCWRNRRRLAGPAFIGRFWPPTAEESPRPGIAFRRRWIGTQSAGD